MAEWTFQKLHRIIYILGLAKKFFIPSDLKWMNRQQGSEPGHTTADEYNPWRPS